MGKIEYLFYCVVLNGIVFLGEVFVVYLAGKNNAGTVSSFVNPWWRIVPLIAIGLIELAIVVLWVKHNWDKDKTKDEQKPQTSAPKSEVKAVAQTLEAKATATAVIEPVRRQTMDDDLYTPIPDDKYYARFGITDGVVTDMDKLTVAYTRVCQRCENEYTLHWTRTAYFWGLIAAIFAGYIAVITSDHYTRIVCMHIDLYLLLFGLVFSAAWLMVIKGSAFWHKNWETHIKKLGEYAAGSIDTTLYCTNKVVSSPDRINGMLAVVTVGVWTLLLVKYFASCTERLCDWHIMLPVVLALVALLLMYFRGRTGGTGIYRTIIPEDENDKGAFINMGE